MISSTLDPLFKQLREMAVLSGISAFLGWDQETYMPSGAIDSRAEQLALMAKLVHERHISSQFKGTLGTFIDLDSGEIKGNGLTAIDQSLLREVYKDWKKATVLPEALVTELSEKTSHAVHAWKSAKDAEDFSIFAPHLENLITLSKEKAKYQGYESDPYDALLDDFEPGMTRSELTPLFQELREGLVPLFKDIQSKASAKDFVSLKGDYDETKQWDFGISILKKMGYDFERGRQDKSSHPFTSGYHPHDIRITTRIDKHDLMEAFSSTVHEGGHGLYEQGLNPEFYGTPLSSYLSLGIHESQSRLWENYVCKSEAFWRGHYPELQSLFPEPLSEISVQDFYKSINQVQSSLIRVGADELSYNLHIMIRYELEQEIFNDGLSVADLPERWNQKYHDYLGIRPKTLSEGILQDIHWSSGLFGYFPTYSLGNLYGRQFYNQALKEMPNLESSIEKGEFLSLKAWLNTQIHSTGRRFSAKELLKEVTGEELSVIPFIDYLREKYTAIYQLKE